MILFCVIYSVRKNHSSRDLTFRLTLPLSTQTPGKTPNKWTEFVKSRYNEIKGDQPPRTPHKDLMKILSEEFKEMKMKNTV